MREKEHIETLRITKPPDLGSIVKAAREDQRLTQADLAELLSTDRFYVSDLEAGKKNLHLTRIFRALNHLGIQLTATYHPVERKAGEDGAG